jgi:hypothetical protein
MSALNFDSRHFQFNVTYLQMYIHMCIGKFCLHHVKKCFFEDASASLSGLAPLPRRYQHYLCCDWDGKVWRQKSSFSGYPTAYTTATTCMYTFQTDTGDYICNYNLLKNTWPNILMDFLPNTSKLNKYFFRHLSNKVRKTPYWFLSGTQSVCRYGETLPKKCLCSFF